MRLKLFDALRQLRHPAEFRISAISRSEDINALLLCLIDDLLNRRAAPSTADVVPLVEGDAAKSLADRNKFIVELCNQYFRLGKHVASMSGGKADVGDLKPLKRALGRLRILLEGEAIVCIDLSGQDYDEGRTDFERFGDLERRPGLAGRLIVECERPLVMRSGQVLQRAKGIVAVPE